MLIPTTTQVASTLFVVSTIVFMLLATSPGWSAGVPAAAAVPPRTRRSSGYDERDLPAYAGEDGEPVAVVEPDKRIGDLARWGKKSDTRWLDNAARKAIRSKWSTSNVSIWGKRMPTSADKRGKWSGNNMPLWG